MPKELAINLATKAVRLILAGPSARFGFTKTRTLTLPGIQKGGIYIHVPFCGMICPYCPYNRVLYNADAASEYKNAIIREIKYYARQLPNLEVTSVYIGGGTPTVIAEDLMAIVGVLRDNFRITGPLCIETNPADLTREKIRLLKSMGTDALSLGVQSFNKKLLSLIGRRYTPEKVKQILAWVEEARFRAVNIDLMFALPGQNLQELEADLETATAALADQITAYPLFTFAYSSVGRYRRLKNVEMPKLSLRRNMYYFIHDYLTNKGYERTSVWSFKKNAETPRYSSVTRDLYVGLGPSAGSYYGALFTLNTFSVDEYILSVREKGHAVALEMPFTPMMGILYDFYWRLYDTHIPEKREMEYLVYRLRDIKQVYPLVRFAELCGMIKKDGKNLALTRKGAFWIHLMQNYFSLRYINTIWGAANLEAWPASIKF